MGIDQVIGYDLKDLQGRSNSRQYINFQVVEFAHQ